VGITAGSREVPGRKPVTRDNNNNNNLLLLLLLLLYVVFADSVIGTLAVQSECV
jgi:hypothetical protein